MSVSAGFLILGRLEDIVHFTKQGKLEYYEGNFDAFRQGCHGVSHDPTLVDEALVPGKRPNWMLKEPRMLGLPMELKSGSL